MSHESKTTRNHDEIRKWVEARDGKPARVRGTENSEGNGLLRINFPGGAESTLENISWDEFFQEFDKRGLEFLFQDEKADGETSTFFKFITGEAA
jgi:hypothetical protein